MKNYQPGRVTPFTRKKMAPLLTNLIDRLCPYPWSDQHLSIVNQLLDKLNQELNTELQAHVDVLNWPGLSCLDGLSGSSFYFEWEAGMLQLMVDLQGGR